MKHFLTSAMLITSLIGFNTQAAEKVNKVPAYELSQNSVITICDEIIEESNPFFLAEKTYVNSITSICLSEIVHYASYNGRNLLIHKNELKDVCQKMEDEYIILAKKQNFSQSLLIKNHCLKNIIENHNVRLVDDFRNKL